MSTLPLVRQLRKTGRIATCPRCRGTGRQGEGLARSRCECCDGRGRVYVVPDQGVFLATQGSDTLEAGGPLDDFMSDAAAVHQLIDGDVAVWHLEEGRGPRLVAVLTRGADGNTETRWL